MNTYEISSLLSTTGRMNEQYWMTIKEVIQFMFDHTNPTHPIARAIKEIDTYMIDKDDNIYDYHYYMENIDVAIDGAFGRRIRTTEGITSDEILCCPKPIAGLAVIGADGNPIIEHVPYTIEENHTTAIESMEYVNAAHRQYELEKGIHSLYEKGSVPLSSVYQCLIRVLQHPEVSENDILYAVSLTGSLMSINHIQMSSTFGEDDEIASVKLLLVGI